MIKQKIKGTVYTDIKIVNNLQRYIDIADEKDLQEGKAWYHEARNFCQALANQYDATLEQVAGITAVMSAQTSWGTNRLFTSEFLKSRGRGVVGNRQKTIKCRNILKLTDYDDIMSAISFRENAAFKTKAFYANIVNPDKTQLTVIDRHQIAACIQRPEKTMPLDNSMAGLTPAQYEFLSECTREVARRVNLSPSACQAVIWVSYRKCRNLFQHKPVEFEVPAYMEENPF